jgi:SAM-dependent methyltransferase
MSLDMDETDSQTNINGWREHWNERAKANEDIIWLNGYCVNGVPLSNEIYYSAVLSPCIDILELEAHHHFLEIGCGAGLFLSEIEKNVKSCVGIDISLGMISRFIGKSNVVVSDARKLPFYHDCFDRILMYSVAHYYPSYDYFKMVIRNALSLLKAKGVFLIGDVPFGDPPANSQYLYYDKHMIINFFDSLCFPYSIRVQNRIKRSINNRYDIIIYKD